MQYEIDYREGIFYVRTFGKVRMEGAIQYFNDLFGHPEWKKGALLLADHRDLDKDWSEDKIYDTVEKVVAALAKYSDKLEGAKIAAVYAQDSSVSTDFGLYDTLLKFLKVPVERETFYDPDKALEWLRSKQSAN
jgi:hypothetical protein